MTNYEHYKDTIIKDAVFQGRPVAVKENGEPCLCGQGISCSSCLFNVTGQFCEEKRKEWFNSEYKEPAIEIDWEKVPIDTPILVKHYETQEKHKRYFAKYEHGKIYAYSDGATSWSVHNGIIDWECAKLANEEDIEKYRKR